MLDFIAFKCNISEVYINGEYFMQEDIFLVVVHITSEQLFKTHVYNVRLKKIALQLHYCREL